VGCNEIITRVPDGCESDDSFALTVFHSLEDGVEVGGIGLDVGDLWIAEVDSGDFLLGLSVQSGDGVPLAECPCGCLCPDVA
jgi:hypothetical protein